MVQALIAKANVSELLGLYSDIKYLSEIHDYWNGGINLFKLKSN